MDPEAGTGGHLHSRKETTGILWPRDKRTNEKFYKK
jgi:hypothetical protein